MLAGFGCIATAQESRRWSLKHLREAYREAYESEDYDRALELLLELERKAPNRPGQAYNLACLHALTGQNDEAVKWLQQSAELGFAGFRLVTFDDDLATIRKRPEFKVAVDRIAGNYKEALATFKAEARAPDPVVIFPPRYDPDTPAPLVVALHGYGGTAPELADAWSEAGATFDAIVIAPRALRRVPNAGYSWGTTDEAEFLVLRAIEHMSKLYKIDQSRIVLTGFSQGAYMSLAIGLRNPERFCGVIPLCGGYHPILVKEADRSVKRFPRFFLMAGDHDRGTQDMPRAVVDLEKIGAPVRLVIYDNTGHSFPPDRVRATRDALRYVLFGE